MKFKTLKKKSSEHRKKESIETSKKKKKMQNIFTKLALFDSEKLFDRFRCNQLSVLQWSYHYLSWQIHSNLFTIYSFCLIHLPMITCQHRTGLDKDLIRNYCLFTNTENFLNDERDLLENVMIVSDNRSYESFEKNFIGLEPYNQSYYPRLFLILGFLVIFIESFQSDYNRILFNFGTLSFFLSFSLQSGQ